MRCLPLRNIEFERHKVLIFLKRYGKQFCFYRQGKNEYGEPTGNKEEISVLGVFHEGAIYVSQNTNDGTKSRSKPQPQILILSDDNCKIKNGDNLQYGNNLYEVTELQDFNKLGIAFDISLEVIDNVSRY